MNAGTLDKRVTFYGKQEVKGKMGIQQKPVPIKTVWARVEPARGREYYEAQKANAETTYKITTRYMKNVTAGMTIHFKDHIFKINSIINPYMKGEKMEFMCVEDKKPYE